MLLYTKLAGFSVYIKYAWIQSALGTNKAMRCELLAHCTMDDPVYTGCPYNIDKRQCFIIISITTGEIKRKFSKSKNLSNFDLLEGWGSEGNSRTDFYPKRHILA